jgi:hypothetical protein
MADHAPPASASERLNQAVPPKLDSLYNGPAHPVSDEGEIDYETVEQIGGAFRTVDAIPRPGSWIVLLDNGVTGSKVWAVVGEHSKSIAAVAQEESR